MCFTNIVSPYHVYIDLTGHPDESGCLAQRIKQAVLDATGLSCSICIAPNKLLAKIGSELDKPDGLTLLRMDDIPTRIWPLKVGKINGIGPKAIQKLSVLGIETIADLAAARPAVLQAHFGLSYANWLAAVAHGRDERPVVTRAEPKSASRETTFERDLHVRRDRAVLSGAFTALCMRVADDLGRKGVVGRTIGIKLRYADFRTVTRELTLPAPTRDATVIRRAAGECLKRVPLDRRIRLLGVRVTALMREDEQAPAAPAQGALRFDEP